MGVIGNLMVKLGLDSSKLTSGLEAAKKSTKQFGNDMDQAGKKTQNSMRNSLGAVTALTGAVTALAAAASAVTTVPTLLGAAAGIKFNATIETNTIALETMLNSAEKAKNMIGDLVVMAAETPFELPDLMTGTKRLLAFGFAEKEILPMLKSIGDAASGLGLSGAEGIGQIGRALGQMKAKTKVQSGEMLQLTEMGIPAWDILSKAVGHSTTETMKLVEKGVVPADAAIQALLKGMSSRFPDMMAKQSKTFTGLWSTLKDTLNVQLGEAMKPIFDWLTSEGLPKAIKWIEGLGAAFGRLKPMMDTIINVLQKVTDKFANMSPEAQASAVKIFLVTAAVAPAVTAIGGLVLAVAGLATVFGAAGGAGVAGAAGVTAFGTAALAAAGYVGVLTAGILLSIEGAKRWESIFGRSIKNSTQTASSGLGIGLSLPDPQVDYTQSSQRAADAAGRNAVYDPKFNAAIAVYNKIKAKAEATQAKVDKLKVSEPIKFPDFSEFLDDLKTGATKVDEFANAVRSLVDTIRSRTKSFVDFAGIFDTIERKAIGGERLLNRMKAQVRAMIDWKNALTALEKRGVSKTFLEDVRSMGPGAVDSVMGLARMSDAQLKQYTGLYDQKYGIAGDQASKSVAASTQIDTNIENQIVLNVTGSKGDATVIANEIVRQLRTAGYKI